MSKPVLMASEMGPMALRCTRMVARHADGMPGELWLLPRVPLSP